LFYYNRVSLSDFAGFIQGGMEVKVLNSNPTTVHNLISDLTLRFGINFSTSDVVDNTISWTGNNGTVTLEATPGSLVFQGSTTLTVKKRTYEELAREQFANYFDSTLDSYYRTNIKSGGSSTANETSWRGPAASANSSIQTFFRNVSYFYGMYGRNASSGVSDPVSFNNNCTWRYLNLPDNTLVPELTGAISDRCSRVVAVKTSGGTAYWTGTLAIPMALR
jgi:hypothetical protein